MMNLPVPSLIVINATNYHHHIPEQHMEVLTPDSLADFLNRILQNEVQVWTHRKALETRCAVTLQGITLGLYFLI